MKSLRAPWNIPVPGLTTDTPAQHPRALPAGPWHLSTPGVPVAMRVTQSDRGTVATMSYDDGTVITATMQKDGAMRLHVNKPLALDLDTCEIRILRN